MSDALCIPPTEQPVMSVVMVTYNAWEWTEKALRALVANTDVDFELVAVDNASSDGTADHLDAVGGAVVIHNDGNHGFGVAANQGVMRSRAPYVLLLNSDALVEPGYAGPLIEILDGQADVAAVAARLLHVDGRLQEAGSVLWGDGRADNVGDGDDPGLGEYGFVRDVDYASAACMLLRRAAFIEAGGFDPVYHPAYFEDADLCLTWRQRGLRVVYQPRSTAVHKRWASTDIDRARELMARNQPVFVERWRRLIGDRPSRPEVDDRSCVLALRDAGCAERVLLVVRSLTGGSVPPARVEALREQYPGARLTLLAVEDEEHGPAAAALAAGGVEVIAAAGDVRSRLQGRRHHHTVVVLGAEIDDAALAAIGETQPLARLIGGEVPGAG